MVASPARTSASPAREQALQKEHDQGSGTNLGDAFAYFDPATCSLRTSQHSLFEVETSCLVTLPSSGTMRSGRCYALPTLVLRTGETASSSWPTARANDAEKRGDFDAQNPRNGLPAAAKCQTWPTPTRSEAKKGHDVPDGQRGIGLNTRAKAHQPWPTPNTLDSLPQRSPEAQERHLRRGDPLGPKRNTTGNLREDAAVWASPLSRDHRSGKSNDRRGRGIQDRPLNEQAVSYELPKDQTSGMTGSPSEEPMERPGLLNLVFVCVLMGFPAEHLQSVLSEMQ